MKMILGKDMTVGMLKAYFKVQTGGTLRVNNNGRKADDGDSLASVGLKDDAGQLELESVMKVEAFEKMMAKVGLTVDVATPDDWVSVPDSMTLEQLHDLPKNATKAQLDALLGKPLVAMVRKDIEDYLINQNKNMLYNERDLQVALAAHLRKSSYKYDSVDLEYLVPIKELIDVNSKGGNPKLLDKSLYPWSNKSSMWIDIVVSKDGYFVPIELKYTTAKVESEGLLTRFGEPVINEDIRLVKDQAASNLVMYNYWKDVRRIELVKRRYVKVVGGIALIVTNSSIYWNASKTRADSAYKPFSTEEGRNVKKCPMKWAGDVAVKTNHQNFEIDGSYTCHWEDVNIQGLDENASNSTFRYCLLEV